LDQPPVGGPAWWRFFPLFCWVFIIGENSLLSDWRELDGVATLLHVLLALALPFVIMGCAMGCALWVSSRPGQRALRLWSSSAASIGVGVLFPIVAVLLCSPSFAPQGGFGSTPGEMQDALDYAQGFRSSAMMMSFKLAPCLTWAMGLAGARSGLFRMKWRWSILAGLLSSAISAPVAYFLAGWYFDLGKGVLPIEPVPVHWYPVLVGAIFGLQTALLLSLIDLVARRVGRPAVAAPVPHAQS